MAPLKTPCAGCDSASMPDHLQLREIINSLKERDGCLIPILQETQRVFGYLPGWAVQMVADGLGLPSSKVYGVITFYSFFNRTPRGKFLVRVCMGTACYIRGAQQVLEAFEEKLKIKVGQTTADRMFTLEIARCFGACGLAPAVSINDKVYKNVLSTKVGTIVDSYYQKSTVKGVA